MAGPRQQALGEETRHRGGERTSLLMKTLTQHAETSWLNFSLAAKVQLATQTSQTSVRNKTAHFCKSASPSVNGGNPDAPGAKGFSSLRKASSPPLSASHLPLGLCALSSPLLSGGPDLHGVTEEHGRRRRRLLSAVCGAADFTRGDDGNVLTNVFE